MVSLQWLEPSVSAFCDRRWLLVDVFCLMQRVRCRHSDLSNWSRFIGVRLLSCACVVRFYDVTSWSGVVRFVLLGQFLVCCPCFWSSMKWQCQAFLIHCLLMMSAVCCWSIILVVIHQMFVSEVGQPCVLAHQMFVSEVGQSWHWYHSVFVTIVWYLGSLMAQGSVVVTML